jgi:hypothetical protein
MMGNLLTMMLQEDLYQNKCYFYPIIFYIIDLLFLYAVLFLLFKKSCIFIIVSINL